MKAHRELVRGLAKPAAEIAGDITPEKAGLIHMIMGVCGESGELLDAIKKHVIYGKELDLDNAVEELGDIEFYLEGLRQQLQDSYGLTLGRDEILDANITKLRKRYPAGYTNASAIARADKAPDTSSAYMGYVSYVPSPCWCDELDNVDWAHKTRPLPVGTALQQIFIMPLGVAEEAAHTIANENIRGLRVGAHMKNNFGDQIYVAVISEDPVSQEGLKKFIHSADTLFKARETGNE